MKNTLTIKRYINPIIKIGDNVQFHDGSSISCDTIDTDIYIVNAYPKLTGMTINLQAITGKVVEVGIDDKVLLFSSCDLVFLQDIVVELGNSKFRTSSAFVHKV
jgi:GTP-sensing pleiotropic transcriptional regulator CodY